MSSALDKLIAETKEQTYDPRAQRCWPWWHTWTMWSNISARQQGRRCVCCGLEQRRSLPHLCVWVTGYKRDITHNAKPIGIVYYQHCDGCGECRRLECAQ